MKRKAIIIFLLLSYITVTSYAQQEKVDVTYVGNAGLLIKIGDNTCISQGSYLSTGNHDWTDPAERVTKKASELNVPVSTPKIGEPIIVGSSDYPNERWWAKY